MLDQVLELFDVKPDYGRKMRVAQDIRDSLPDRD
jgi:hypothetical protein